ncbi:SdrD B-like domain-containing protein [Spirosoma fluminis]
MEVTSTLRKTHVEPVVRPPFRPESDRQAARLTSITRLISQVVYFLMRLSRRNALPVPVANLSITSRFASRRPTGFVRSGNHTARSPVESVGEPPDIPDPGPPTVSIHDSQKTVIPFVHNTMNEQLILRKSLDDAPPRKLLDTGRGLTSVTGEPYSVSSLGRLLSSFTGLAYNLTAPVLNGVYILVAVLAFGLISSTARGQAPATINLSVNKSISNQSPAIGDIITYTVVVTNAPGSATATNVVVRDELPAGGVSYIAGSATFVRGNGTFSPVTSTSAITATMSISSIAPGDSAVLVLGAIVLQRGVWFNTAEVIAADQTDTNSSPNNGSLAEDDYDAVCFSVPIFWYAGEEFTVTIPSGYDQVVWYRNEVPISTSAVSTSLAEVGTDLSLVIKSPGVYRFDTYRNGCLSGNCCNIVIVQGPFGSLGDYVFVDTNRNGRQDDGPTGLDGVTVYLYDGTGTTRLDSTITSGGGRYLFDSLADGNYVVRFVTPAGYQSTSANVGGAGDDLDSDAGPNGFTGVYTIDTSQPESSTARNNTTVDAGFYVPGATLGDRVFVDANRDGQQGPPATEPGIPDVVVTLISNGNVVASTVTDASGLYSFTGLTPGVPYSVSFATPAGYSATQANIGNDASDSDPIGGITAPVSLTDGENNTTIDAGFYLPTATLGDRVFVDANRDGQQGPIETEPGIPNVVVTLISNGNVVASTVTNASGLYSFTGLTPGVPYSVSFTTPAGYTATQGNLGDDASDSDPVNGITAPVTLTAGENNLTIDAGFYGPPTTPEIQISIVDPAVCDPATNIYTNSGVVSLTNTPGGILTLTDNGVLIASFTITAGQTSVPFSATGQSGTAPTSRTIVATINTLTVSTVYAVPASCTVCSPIAVTPATLALGNVGKAYSQTLTASGGSGPYAYAVLGGALPAGLSLNNVTGVLSGTPTTAAVSAFTVVVTDSRSCSGVTPVSLTVNTSCPTDFSITVPNDFTICNGETGTLVASSPVPGAKICWYLTPYAGTAFAIVNNGQAVPVNPTSTTVYYVEVTTADSCASARVPVVVTVTTVPTPICLGNIRNTCPATTVDLTQVQIENQTTGLIYEWYTSLTRTPQTRVTNLTTVGAGTYYLFARNGNCYSNPTVLTVEIVNCNCQNVAQVNVGPGRAICAGEVIPLVATVSGTSLVTGVTWTSNGSGTFSNPNSLTTTYTPSPADIASGSVLLTATTNDPDGPGGVCSAATSSLIANINPRPDAPVGVACDDTLVCQGSNTKLIGFAPGNRINWYDQDNNLVGTTPSGGKLVITLAKAGAVVYTAEAISDEGCVSPTRSSLTITVGTCLADLAIVKTVVTPGPYSIGQKVTYSLTVSNKGKIAASNVTVNDLLPASLAYVSSTPGGEYNAGSGIWTVGSLGVGSNRSLLIEATIAAAGPIRNTAIVNSPDKDPNFALDDTSSVVIQTNTCALLPPQITCAVTEICQGGSTTLQAVGCEGGTVRWSDGQTGLTVSVSPTVTTTYSASCVVVNCTSVASNPITVNVLNPQTPVITASASAVCPGSSVTLTASGCVGGTIEWSDKAQTGASIVVTPYTKTTYTAQCRIAGCLSKPATKTIDISPELPTPTIVCSTTGVCPGETVTLTVENCLGTPVWNSTTATTGSIVVTPTVGNNSYSVYCTNGSCVSKPSPTYTIAVTPVVAPTIVASADSVCAKGLVSLTATGCTGTVVWNAVDTYGNNLTGSVIKVNPDASISYYAQCKYRTCLSEPSNAVDITVVTPQTPIIRIEPNKAVICSGEKVRLIAEGCSGTVQWYGINRVGASIEILPTETTEYYATCKQGSCESEPSLKVRITVNKSSAPSPTVTASTTTLCNGGVVSLTASGCTGTILWSDGQTGQVVSVTATPTNNEFYAVCKVGDACATGKSNVIKVNVTSVPAPTVTCSTGNICPGETVTLTVNNCQGTPYWSTNETTTTIVVSPTVTTSYTVYCQNGVCKSETSPTYTITVTPVPAPTIVASATAVEPGGTITLTATGCIGDVVWSANDINGNNQGTSIVVRPVGTQTYYAQCKYRICLSDPSNTITVNPGDCTVKPGTLTPVTPTVCATSNTPAVLTATPAGGLVQPDGYSVLYVLTKGAELVVQQTSATPSFTVASGSGNYTIHTLVYNANPADKNYLDLSAVKPGITTGSDVIKLITDRNVCAALDLAGAKIGVRSVQPPVLHTASLTVCYGATVTLEATGCEGGVVNWSDGSVGQSIQKTALSDIWLMATCTIDGCTSGMSNTIDVILGTPGIPTIVTSKPVVCTGETATLVATGCTGGTYIWSDGVTVGNTLTVNPTADVSYRVRCKVGSCEGEWSPYSTIKVGSPGAPTISIAGPADVTSTTACFGAPVTLVAKGCPANAYVTWSNDLVGSTITVSLANSVTYTARCCVSNSCKSEPSNPVTITVLPKVSSPTTVDRTNTCPFNTVDLATGVTSAVSTVGGVFEYYTSASLSPESRVASPAAVGSGTYYVVERTVNGCYGLPAVMHVFISTCDEQAPCNPVNPAKASAGADASICTTKTYQLNGVMGGAGKTAHWTTSGSGTFDNPYALNAVYTASAEDVLSGKVTLTLSVSTNNASCPVAKDDMLLTIEGSKSVPTVKVIGAVSFCYGDSVRLEAPAGATYLWSNQATTQSIVVKNSGAYSVQLFDPKGCSSVKSEDVVVTVGDPGATPLVSNLRNDCPAQIVNLTSALSATTAGSTYEYRIGSSASSQVVMRPDSVGAGTYYVFARNGAGCLSAPSKVVVNIFNCTADSLTTDVSIAKTASASVVKHGEPVVYTIQVANQGAHTARNIDVRDVLPQGLELVADSTLNYVVSNGAIHKRIDSLQAGQSVSFSFAARVVAKGEVVNKAEITYLDQRDTNLANNTSSVSVRDTSAYTPSRIGIAKSVVGIPTAEGDSIIKVAYNFIVTNFGDDTLRNVGVVDDLAYFFVPNTVFETKVALGPNTTFRLNPNFTGTGVNTNMLDSTTSYLAPGRSQAIRLDVRVRRVAGDTATSFRNLASASAVNSVTSVYDLSVDGGDSDPDNDGDPTNNFSFSTFTLGVGEPGGPGIGLALAVTKIAPQPDSTYNVTFKATIKNFGDVYLYGISLTDSLAKAFASPVSYSMVGAPIVGAGSNLAVNPAFDGNTDANLLAGTSNLAPSEQDTVVFTMNVKLNGNLGPFFSTATVVARTEDSTQTVSDISNAGLDPTPSGAASTTVRFDLPKALLGVAKSVGTPTRVEEGVYDIPYTIQVTNLGSVPLKNVQVEDNLSETFGHGALIVNNRIPVTAGAGLTVDSLYTGQGLITKMLVDSLSNLAVGVSSNLTFTVRVDVRNADSLTFYNVARATALTLDGEAVEDTSTAGTNNDPDYDLDPRNNSEPTPVALNNLSTSSYIGLAMAVSDTVRKGDGSYDVTYKIVVKNYGIDPMTHVAISDSLSKVFNSQTGATYTVVNAPITISTGSTLKLNPAFNGGSDPMLVLGDSTSTLAAGQTDTIQVVINVAFDGSTTTFLNSAYGQAITKTGRVEDISTTGLNPDLNGNNNPTDVNEREATALSLEPTFSAVFIPEGFSPNGDGINDLFVIRGTTGLSVTVEIYNRWGNLVYQNSDYRNDWDGKSNTGVNISSDAAGVPDGTYYYVIKTSDGRKFVRYMTINR